VTLILLPRSTFLIVLNLAIALIVGAIGFGVGFAQGQSAQSVLLFTVLTVAVLFWFGNYVAVAFENRQTAVAAVADPDGSRAHVGVRSIWIGNRALIIAMALLLLAYLIATATSPLHEFNEEGRIPGLLDAGQMRELLRRQQEEQYDRRTRDGVTTAEPVTRHGQLRDLRRELNALVTAAHYRLGKPHGWIHNELRRLCGGPPVAAATSEQLAARITAVRGLTA